MPAIMVDMAPASSSPQPTPMDLAPGPVMQQADASPPPEPAKPETVQDMVDFIVGRIADQLGVQHQLLKRWGTGLGES